MTEIVSVKLVFRESMFRENTVKTGKGERFEIFICWVFSKEMPEYCWHSISEKSHLKFVCGEFQIKG